MSIGTDTQTDALAETASTRGEQRRRVLLALNWSPMTDEELGEALGIRTTSAGARRHELVESGLVIDSGARIPGKAGLLQIVWQVAPPPDPAWLAEKVWRKTVLKSVRRLLLTPGPAGDELAVVLANWPGLEKGE